VETATFYQGKWLGELFFVISLIQLLLASLSFQLLARSATMEPEIKPNAPLPNKIRQARREQERQAQCPLMSADPRTHG
jgi:hypothetical protein